MYTVTNARAVSTADLVIRHAYVLTMDDVQSCIPDGAVVIRNGEIVAVDDDLAIGDRWSADRVIDAGGAPCHPGLVEAHSHLTYQTFRGVVPDHLSEDDVFACVEQPFYNNVGEADELAAAAHACVEMIRNGTTCFLEAGTALHPEAVAQAAVEVGIRGLVGDSFVWDEPSGFAMGEGVERQVAPSVPGRPGGLTEALARLGRQVRERGTASAHNRVAAHIAVLGLGTASEALLVAAKHAADCAGTVLNLHHSYSPADAEADRRRFGQDPLVHLAEIGVLDRNVTLAHVNHVTDAECDAILETGASIVWAPAASMMWGHGSSLSARHAELWLRGANVALGSDSPNWSNDFDLFKQISLAVLVTRERSRQRDRLVAEDGLFMATRGGARAAGLDRLVGSIEVGKRADVVVHTLRRPELLPRTDMVRNLVYSARSKSIATVIVDGKVILDEGRFTQVDADAILSRVDERSAELLRRMHVSAERNRVERAHRMATWLRRH